VATNQLEPRRQLESRRRSRIVVAAIPIAIAIASFARPYAAEAQTLAGRILESTSGAAVRGALTRLIDANGTPVGTALTDSAGRYFVRAPTPGTYTLRIERIGYSTFRSDSIDLRADVVRDFRIDVVPIELPAVVADAKQMCTSSDRLTTQSEVIWGEIRKALDLTSWTSSNALVEYTVSERTRWFEPSFFSSRAGPRKVSTDKRRGSPFAALASDSLLQKGFIQEAEEEGHFVYYAPDAALIASDEFQSTHCFQAKFDKKKPKQIGLSFEPTGEVGPYDVRGTLWIDRATGLLTHLEYSYNKLPVDAPSKTAGGDVEFVRLPNGMWIISSWRMRVPIMTRLRTSKGMRPAVGNIQQKSQSVVEARIGGRVVYTGTPID
jgi:hypothetical protein